MLYVNLLHIYHYFIPIYIYYIILLCCNKFIDVKHIGKKLKNRHSHTCLSSK